MRLLSVMLASLTVLAACQPATPAAPTSAPTTAANASKAAAPPTAAPAAAAKPAADAAKPPAAQAQPAAGAGHSAEVERLLAAAKAANETELRLSWSQNTVGGSEGARRYSELFNRMYGMNIQVRFTPGPSMTDMSGKIVQEAVAGQRASSDILLGGEGHFGPLHEKNALESYDYSLLSPRITREFLAPGNIGVEFASRVPGITYNTQLVQPNEVPRKLADVLDSKWKGKFASTVNAASFDRVAARPEWSPESMLGYVRKLSGEVAGLIRCGESQRIISGEYQMLVMDCGSYEVRKQVRAGAPLGHVIPEDAATIAFWYLGIPRTSSAPNLAKLYINAIMSEEGQKILWDLDGTDHYALPGSQSAAELEQLRAKGVQPFRADAKWVAANPKYDQLADDLTKLLRERPQR